MNVILKKVKKINLIFFLIFLYKNSYALSIEQLIDLAEKQNPELIKIKKELAVLKKKVKVAKKWFNPSISVSVDGEELLKSPLESGKIYIKQYIPYPKKFDISKNIEKRKYMSEYYLLIAKKENIFSQLYSTAYSIYLTERFISIYSKYINILESIKKNVFNPTDKIRIENEILSIKENRIKYKYEKEKLLSKLSKLVNNRIDRLSVKLKKKYIKRKLQDLIDSINKSPYYLSVKQDIEKSKEIYRLSRMVFYPDFTVRVRIDTGGSLTEAFSLGIDIKLPLWRTVKQEQEVLSKQFEIISEKEKLRYIFLNLKTDIEQSYYNIKLSGEILPILEKHIKLLNEEIKDRKEKFSTVLEVITPVKKVMAKEIEREKYIYLQNLEFIKIKAVLGEL